MEEPINDITRLKHIIIASNQSEHLKDLSKTAFLEFHLRAVRFGIHTDFHSPGPRGAGAHRCAGGSERLGQLLPKCQEVAKGLEPLGNVGFRSMHCEGSLRGKSRSDHLS